MKQVSSGLRDLLYNNEQHILADLWTFAFADGTRYWTSSDLNITSGATTWLMGPGIERGNIRCETGLAVDTLSVTVYPDATTINGVSMVQAALAGYFDNVRVTLQRAYMLTPGDTSAGLVTEFDGYVAQVKPSATSIVLAVKSVLSKLGEPLPKRVVMAQCPYSLGGTACGVNLASFTDARTVAAGSTATVVNLSSSSTQAVAGGYIKFTSGALNGVVRNVRSVSGAAVTLTMPLPAVPAVGDALNVVRGCDKTRSTCNGTFNNLVRFGGFPDAPKSESV